MDKLINNDNRLISIVHRIEDSILVAITSTIVVFSGLQIILRNGFDSGIAWIPPMMGTLVIWVGLLGALIATRNNAHIKINLLTTYLPDKYKPFAFTVSHGFSAFILIFLSYYSVEFIKLDLDSNATVFANVPAWLAQSILPITCMLMSLRYVVYTVCNIIEIVRKDP